ncbi:MAG TPA: TonB-dependent receptor [Terriglobales bacterium]|nr:TonB-dependent receptor [Terriglobales bacterium]
MRRHIQIFQLLFAMVLGFAAAAHAQQVGGAGTIEGTVTDPSGAVIAGATVVVHNPITGFTRSAQTDASGNFTLQNLPPNGYHLSVTQNGFQGLSQDVDVRSSVPITLRLTLQIGEASTTVNVTDTADLIENQPTAHTDIGDRTLQQMPLQTTASGLSDLIMHAAPGVAADSNGFFHPQGDHAQAQLAIDGEPITDQQSRAYSNQVSPQAVQSMEVITGVPPAEFGDKDSMVVRMTTKSGLGQRPNGSIGTSYGSFGTGTAEFNFGAGGQRWGEFVSATGLRTGRYLDSPEFATLHDIGNNGTFFNRLDFQPTQNDTLHLDLFVARSWFQIPNTYDQAAVGQDQRQKVVSFNIAPGLTHLFSATTLLTVNAYMRRDHVNYYPSGNPFSDLPATMSQSRQLTNWGVRSDLSYSKGRNNAKFGVDLKFTPLSETFALGITDPVFNAPCVDANGNPVSDTSLTSPAQCAGALSANSAFQPGLAPFDLSRGGSLFHFHDTGEIKQEAAYAQDSLTLGNATLLFGTRFDHYDGLVQASALEPRVGASYEVKRTATVLKASYGREFETPYNENLLLSSAPARAAWQQTSSARPPLRRSSPGAATTSAPELSRRSASGWRWMRNTGGSSRETPTTSTRCSTPRLPSPSPGQSQSSMGWPFASAFRIITASASTRSWGTRARGTLTLRSAASSLMLRCPRAHFASITTRRSSRTQPCSTTS